jgi:hypothetical protein
MPSLNMMSNSAVRNGGATLFLTTLTRVRLPMTSSPTLMDLDAAHIEAQGGVELERLTACGGFGVAEHDADLLAELVGENDGGLGLVDGAGEFAERLRHKTGLHTHGGIAHVAFDFGARNERGHGVDDNDIHSAGADEGFGDLERLFTGIGLGDEQVVNIHTEATGIDGVEGVFHINEGGGAASFLRFGDDVLAEVVLPEDSGP